MRNQLSCLRRFRAPSLLTALVLVAVSQSASAEVPWQRSPSTVLQSARQTGKPILVFGSAQWCHYCQKMKQETWSDPRVDVAVSQNFETLVLDADRNKQVVNKLGLSGYPATLLYTPDGHFVAQKGGYMPPDATLHWLASERR